MIAKLLEKTVVAAANWALDKVFGPPVPPSRRAPGQLSPRDVAIQNRASHVAEEHKVRPECVACLDRPEFTGLAGCACGGVYAPDGKRAPEVSSPRAITHDARPLPPPRKR
jgi:hypothetical protein